jgi:hypothetical protein
MKKKDKDALIEIANKKLTATIANDKTIIARNKSSRSFSKTFLDFLEPLLANEILDEEETRALLNWGLIVWNKVVAESRPDLKTSIKAESVFALFCFGLKDRSLVNEYLLRKDKFFSKDIFFIYNYELHVDDKGNMAVSVAAIDIE